MEEPTELYSIDEVRLLPTASGIYAIVNTKADGARYVGQARNIRQRVATHVRDLDLGRERTNADMLLQKAWFEYGRAAFVFAVLELVEDNERATVARVRNSNLALAEHYYISVRSEYNKDKRIVRADQLALVESKAWRAPIDAESLVAISKAARYAYKVGTRVDYLHAVIVSAFNEDEAKRIARSVSAELATLLNLSSSRLSRERLNQALLAGVPDHRHVASALRNDDTRTTQSTELCDDHS